MKSSIRTRSRPEISLGPRAALPFVILTRLTSGNPKSTPRNEKVWSPNAEGTKNVPRSWLLAPKERQRCRIRKVHIGENGSKAARACTHKSRVLWWSSGDLLPPSPPAEKATARKDQARKASTPKAKRAGYRMASTLSRRSNLRGQTICWRRRRTKARRAPQAATRPGNPAPTIGPGTAETEVSSSSPVTA
jgi:hypothetical protein